MHDPRLSDPPDHITEPRQTQPPLSRAPHELPTSQAEIEDPYEDTYTCPDKPVDMWSDTELHRIKEHFGHPLQEDARRELEQRHTRRTDDWVFTDADPAPINVEEIAPSGVPTQRYHALTVYPLTVVNRLDYESYCKYCDSYPYPEGPQHDSDCPRHAAELQLNTRHAIRKHCKHCRAKPFLAGFHHKEQCPRGFTATTDWAVADDNYNTPCVCGAKPYSEGPHHTDTCKYYQQTPAFRTERAHAAKCQTCKARPFPPGPHHRESCEHYVAAVPVPTALL